VGRVAPRGGRGRRAYEGSLQRRNARQGVSQRSYDLEPFEVALEAYRPSEGRYSGIGFVLSSGDLYVGLDLDECRDPKTGEIAPWAQKIIDRVQQGHIEISPSGAGVHVIIEGMMRGQKTQRKVPGGGKIEMYYQQRFLTVTGNVL
jgi:primase-polymerase (primpol)-like protein